MQEQLPSLHAVHEQLFGIFNDTSASKVIFQRFFSSIFAPAEIQLKQSR